MNDQLLFSIFEDLLKYQNLAHKNAWQRGEIKMKFPGRILNIIRSQHVACSACKWKEPHLKNFAGAD